MNKKKIININGFMFHRAIVGGIRKVVAHQDYLNKIINKYPEIKSGRKNYHDHYIRVLKNTLLTKFFTQKTPSSKFLTKCKFSSEI